MATCQIYPFVGTNAKLFSEELIHYVLNEFGHNVQKPQRRKAEESLVNYEMFSFTPEIGKTVAYLSRKHATFVVMMCYKSWKYIKSHRVSVMKDLLYKDISFSSTKYYLEKDDLALFLFMAIVVEYARFAIVDGQEELIETVANALSFCMTDGIPGGYVTTIGRLKHRASSFNLPELSINPDNDSEKLFRKSMISFNIQAQANEFRISLNYKCPLGTQYNVTKEELETLCKQRELRRGLVKHQLKGETYCKTLNGENTSVVNHQKNVARCEYAKESSSTEECKLSEPIAKTQSKCEENSANYYKSSEKAKTENIRKDQIQPKNSEVSSKDVSLTDLYCPMKNDLDEKDISEAFEKINFEEVANESRNDFVDEVVNREQNFDRTSDDSIGNTNSITP